ncbi:Metallo-dependent phosphatase-like protein [Flammula alnicola]|nr:Metallo-dependent phosphatase-like protein [Flammula alnicola]
MLVARLLFFAAVTRLASASIQPSTFTYYNSPTATLAQPQPVISDPVTHEIYPFALTNPNTIPINDTADPHPLPPVASSSRLFDNALAQLKSIASSPIFGADTCGRCQAILGVAKFVSLATPANGPSFFIQFCNTFKLASNCSVMYGQFSGIGSVLTQVVANADAGGYDGQALCQNFFSMCPAPPTVALNLTGWFAKPKPSPLPAPKQRSGKRLNVLHLSDIHLDPRFATGAEANCTSGTCCRANNHNIQSPNKILSPAPRYGAYLCDTPLALALSALEAVPALTGTKDTGFAWTVYTGDLVSHDPDNQLSRSVVQRSILLDTLVADCQKTIVYDIFKRLLGSGPVYAALGNHDSYNQAQDAPHSLGGALAQQFSWNYDHVSGLWQHENWIPESAVELASAHYAAYMVKRVDGLRIITLNTDMSRTSRANYFNYINMTNPDTSGMLRFLTDELQDAEDAGDRVIWIIGHKPTNLCIVDRFSPHVIASHTHEDQINIFYGNNATVMSADTAQAVSWIGPSVTPLTNLNSGFRVYEVDSATFEIVDAHTWRADVNSFPGLDPQTAFGPTYAYEYNTRETYGSTISGWGANDPLNATWWHRVTEAMEANSSLVTTFNTFQGKGSVLTPPCVGDCITAKICYMRSGSVSIATKNCQAGFGSVQ